MPKDKGKGAAKPAAPEKPEPDAGKSEALAAVAEVAGGEEAEEVEGDASSNGHKTVEWQGLTIELPELLPEVVVMDMVEYEASRNPFAIYRALRSIIGPGQFVAVRQLIDELSKAEGDESDADLFDTIFVQYGLTLGKSSD